MRREPVVLDASAVLAFLFDETGAELVHGAVPGATLATVNWSEVCRRLLALAADPLEARVRLADAGLAFAPLTVDDARRWHVCTPRPAAEAFRSPIAAASRSPGGSGALSSPRTSRGPRSTSAPRSV